MMNLTGATNMIQSCGACWCVIPLDDPEACSRCPSNPSNQSFGNEYQQTISITGDSTIPKWSIFDTGDSISDDLQSKIDRYAKKVLAKLNRYNPMNDQHAIGMTAIKADAEPV